MSKTEVQVKDDIVRLLKQTYGYSASQIEVSPRRAIADQIICPDLIVFQKDDRNSPFVVVETKPQSYFLPGAIEQLEKYMRAIKAPYGILTNGVGSLYYRMIENTIYEIWDIPAYSKSLDRPKKQDLKPMHDLGFRLESISSYIMVNSSFSTHSITKEINKILLCKLIDEKIPLQESLFWADIEDIESKKGIIKRIEDLFNLVKEHFPNLYSNTEEILLNESSLRYAVNRLQNYNLTSLSGEELIREYNQFVRQNMFQKMGQYFTPKELADFLVELVKPEKEHIVLDPACGSGGFLLSAMQYNKQRQNQESGTKKLDSNNIFGLDISQEMTSVAKINMILCGKDGSNIMTADFLDDLPLLIKSKKFDIIITDPPYGIKIKDSRILEKFDLCSRSKFQQINALFFEKCIRLLSRSGRMGIIVPEIFLTGQTFRYVRDYVRKTASIKAIISLPGIAIAPYSNLRINIIILSKQQLNTDYPVCMAQADNLDKKTVDCLVNALYDNIIPMKGAMKDAKLFSVPVSKLGMRWDVAFHSAPVISLKGNFSRLSSIAQVQSGAYIQSKEYLGTPVIGRQTIYIRVSDIDEKGSLRHSTAKILPRHNSKVVTRAGDLLISVRGTIGKIALIEKSIENGIPSNQLVLIRCDNKKVYNKYLLRILQSDFIQSRLKTVAVGANIPFVTLPEIRRLPIPLPSMESQKRVATKIEKITNSEATQSQKNRQVNSIIKKLLNGEYLEPHKN